jgi:nitronate monooxygenase
MSLPDVFKNRLKIPTIAAPMFLTSGPDLVLAVCRSGIVGTFPALNQRTSQGYELWLQEIVDGLNIQDGGDTPAPFGINLIVHKSNPRLHEDLSLTVKHKVPLVITSLGAVADVIDAVHSYGGLVFHDVTNMRHAEKAIQAGVDGIIAVCTGAGGHAGTLSPFALVSEIAEIFSGTIVLSGAMSTGRHIAAARMLGADMAYLGTRFIATKESLVSQAQKQMLLDSTAADIVYTARISGVAANFLRPSLAAAGIDLDGPDSHSKLDLTNEGKVWKTLWSAGQGVGSIRDVPAARELCARLIDEYHVAISSMTAERPLGTDGGPDQ